MKQEEREPVKTTLYLDDHLVREAKKYAIDHRTSLSQLVEALLAKFLKPPGKSPIKA